MISVCGATAISISGDHSAIAAAMKPQAIARTPIATTALFIASSPVLKV
jgi:hypothetical protein